MTQTPSRSFAGSLPACFAYPLHWKYLLVIAGATLFTTIVAMFPRGNDLGYWFILLVICRVGFDAIDRFAAGVFTHAEAAEIPSGGFARPFKYWLILLAMDFLVSKWARKYGYAAGLGADVITSLVLPGMTIVLARTGSLRATFNASEWLRVMNAAPGTMILLAFLSLGIDQASYLVDEVLFPAVEVPDDAEVVPETPLVPIAAYTLVVTYLWLVNFCMIGAAVHAHRDELEADESTAGGPKAPVPATESPEAKRHARHLALERNVREAVAQGRLAHAEREAHEATREDPYDAEAHALYHEVLMRQADTAKAMSHARRYMAMLQQAGRSEDAIALFKECVAADAAFRPEPDKVLELARLARSQGDVDAAVAMLRGFDKANVGHPDIPAVYLLSAQMMAEDLGHRDMARRILEHLLARYPGHSIAPEAQRYLKETT